MQPETVKAYEGHTIDGAQITYGQPVGWVTEAYKRGEKVAHWSHPTDPPPLCGSTVKPNALYRGAKRPFGEGVVIDYKIEYGFLFARVSFPNMPKKYRRGSYEADLMWVAGIDLWKADK